MQLAITLGDVTGIGPEVTVKALALERERDQTRYVILGDPAWLERAQKQAGVDLGLQPYSGPGQSAQITYLNPFNTELPANMPHGAVPAAKAAMAWLHEAAKRCLAGEFAGMVTAPVSKEAIVSAGHTGFIGQTELLSGLARTDRTAMMLLGPDDRDRWLRVILATTHVPIRELPAKLTREKICLAIEMADQACRDLRLPRARIGVCGLNPHAGEGGKIGDEEIHTITPAVEEMRRRGIDAVGPVSADALFFYAFQGGYDVVVAMYHDQGLAPLKMIAFENGVNWTVGLPFIRTSPDHGTAYNIAGRNRASPTSMVAALRLARQLAAK